jgi:beta-lactamase regulating signal transducer with metallopeptidase domain
MAADLLRALIAANLAAALAVLVVLALRKPARRLAGARLAYALWLIAPVAAAASLLPARPASLPTAAAAIGPQQMAQMVTTLIYDAAPGFDWPALLVGVWAVGAAIALAFVLRRQHVAIGLLGRLSTQPDGLVRAANAAVGPAVIGVVAPRVVLPADFEDRFSPREQALIIAHERSHLRTGDARINAAISLLACLNWFNPLVHLAAPRIREDQEMACDEAVTTTYPGERRAYAEALLKTQVLPVPLPLGCYWPARTPRKLKERIVMLTRKTPGHARRLIGAAAITVLAASAGYAAWAAQPADPAPQIERHVILRHAGEGEAIDLSDLPELSDLAALPGAKVMRRVEIHHGDGVPGGIDHMSGRMAVIVGDGKGEALAKAMAAFPDGPGTVAMTCKVSEAGAVEGCIILPGQASADSQAMAMSHIKIMPLKAPAGTSVTILQSFAP